MSIPERDIVVQEIKKLFQEQKYTEAIDKIKSIGEPAEEDYEIQTLLGAMLSKLKRGDEAVDVFRVALRLKPNSAQSFYNLAAQLYANGRVGESRTLLDQAIMIDPNNKPAYYLLQKIENKSATSVPTSGPMDTTQQIPKAQDGPPDPSSFQVPGRQGPSSSAPPPSAGAYQATPQQPGAQPPSRLPQSNYSPNWNSGYAVKTKWTESITGIFGDFWVYLGWLLFIGMVVIGVFIRIQTNTPDQINPMLLTLSLVNIFLAISILFWLIVDVIDNEAGWWWILIAFCCGCIGFIIYMIKGRNG